MAISGSCYFPGWPEPHACADDWWPTVSQSRSFNGQGTRFYLITWKP
jgi:hypothetical protein